MTEHRFDPEGISPLGTLRVVSVQDPALDLAAMQGVGVRAYLDTRDPVHLRFLPGLEREATWYTLRPLTRAALNRFVEEASGNDRERWRRALAACLVRVENAVDLETGQTQPGAWEPTKTVDATEHLGCRIVSDADLERYVATDDAIEELGLLCYARAKLHPKERRGCGLPPGSDKRTAARLLRAEAKARDAVQTASRAQQSAVTGSATATASALTASP